MKRYPFGKFILSIPDDHRIADIHQIDSLYDRTFTIIAERIGDAESSGVIVDIGANIGDTAAALATVCSNPILCVEGGDNFLAYLRSNRHLIGPQVSVIEAFVIPSLLESLNLSYAGGTGTGGLAVSGGAPEGDVKMKLIGMDDVRREAKALGGDVVLFKTDTDGLDGYIVDEAIDTFDCPIFFECDTNTILPDVENPWPGVFDKLDKRSYSVAVFDNHGLPMLIAESGVGSALRDLSGYTHMQRSVQPTRIHYTDVWAFPKSWTKVAADVFQSLRADYLKPYRF